MSDRRRTPTYVGFQRCFFPQFCVFWASNRQSFNGVCVCVSALLFSNIFSCQKLNYWKSVREVESSSSLFLRRKYTNFMSHKRSTHMSMWRVCMRSSRKKIPLYANLVGEVLYLFLASTHSFFPRSLPLPPPPSFLFLSYFHFKFVFLAAAQCVYVCVRVCVCWRFFWQRCEMNRNEFLKLVFLPSDRIGSRISKPTNKTRLASRERGDHPLLRFVFRNGTVLVHSVEPVFLLTFAHTNTHTQTHNLHTYYPEQKSWNQPHYGFQVQSALSISLSLAKNFHYSKTVDGSGSRLWRHFLCAQTQGTTVVIQHLPAGRTRQNGGRKGDYDCIYTSEHNQERGDRLSLGVDCNPKKGRDRPTGPSPSSFS